MKQQRKLLLAALALGVVVSLGVTVLMKACTPRWAAQGGVLSGPNVPPATEATVRYQVRSGDTIAGILQRYGLPSAAVIEAGRAHYDLARINSGREIRFGYTRGLPHASWLSYPMDSDGDEVLVVRWDAGEQAWTADVERVVYEERLVSRRFEIETSLWNAALHAGLRPDDIVRLAEIFQWDIDFNTELREGDTFTMVADALYLDGELRKLGDIHAVMLQTDDDPLIAIRHVGANGEVGYFDPDGKARRKPFLRSPLAFSRVSSGFAPRGRLHPVTGKRRPHNGTDFAAPTGTPVRAVGNGTVTRAGGAGGYGLLVRIRHDGGYESGYAHLSKILVRKGERVKQGQTIGKVGSTGLSTGPHCHYELKLNGSYIDPMRAKLPVSVPLPSSEKAAFAAERERWLPVLEGAAAGAPEAPEDE